MNQRRQQTWHLRVVLESLLSPLEALAFTVGHLMMDEIEEEALPETSEYIHSRNGVDFILSSMVLSAADEVVEGLSNNKSSSYIAEQNARNEEQDNLKAQAAVEDYLKMLLDKQSSITHITWSKIPKVSGSYYYFSCTVEYADLKREGTVTVRKESDGTFKVTGLELDD